MAYKTGDLGEVKFLSLVPGSVSTRPKALSDLPSVPQMNLSGPTCCCPWVPQHQTLGRVHDVLFTSVPHFTWGKALSSDILSHLTLATTLRGWCNYYPCVSYGEPEAQRSEMWEYMAKLELELISSTSQHHFLSISSPACSGMVNGLGFPRARAPRMFH